MDTAVRVACLAALLWGAGCSQSLSPSGADSGAGGGDTRDLAIVYVALDLTMDPSLNECGDTNPTCTSKSLGPPFPLEKDQMPDPAERDDSLLRDGNGWLGLDQSHAGFNHAWTANTDDWHLGTVSKWDVTKVREVARYFTVTCNSLPGGNKNPCDGMARKGCCAYDSYPEYTNRSAGMAAGPAQQVELSHVNYPSRTAVDLDGSVWVANRALYQQGAQSSVTRIANIPSKCIDRNNNGLIETSKDTNEDGIIETDCNGDLQPDDIASVKRAPCTNGRAQEFYGLDDECVIVTTNTGLPDSYGRPLALGPGARDPAVSDVWAGLFNTKQVFRIDGATGRITQMLTLPCSPYGFAIDSKGIGWAANLGASGCYWDTKNIQHTGVIRNVNGQSSYGIGLDRDQNVWFGGGAARYTPVRNGNFADLGSGSWTVFTGISGSGVAVDSRSKDSYFAYFAGSKLYQVPATRFPPIVGQDQSIDAAAFPSVPVFGGYGKGVGITLDGNVVVTSGAQAGLQRVNVDAMGVMAMPDLMSPALGNNKCPTGDFCNNTDHGPMQPYTYSDFTGFGLRNFTSPRGFYSYVVRSTCIDQGFGWGTHWVRFEWDAVVPANTSLTARARDGKTPIPDISWSPWSAPAATAPLWLTDLPGDSDYLEVEVDLSTSDRASTAKLKSAKLYYECLFVP